MKVQFKPFTPYVLLLVLVTGAYFFFKKPAINRPTASAAYMYKKGAEFVYANRWDSAEYYCRRAAIQVSPQDSTLIYPKSLSYLIGIYHRLDKREKVLTASKELHKWAVQNKNDTFLLQSYKKFATYYYMGNNLPKALSYIDRARAVIEARKDTYRLIDSNLSKGILYQEMGRLNEAEFFTDAGIRLAEQSRYKNSLYNLHTTQANIYLDKKQFEQAYHTYYFKVLKAPSLLYKDKVSDYNNLTNICAKWGRYKLAEAYLDSAKQEHILIDDDLRIERHQRALSLYTDTKQFDKLKKELESYRADLDSLYQYRTDEANKTTKSDLANERQIYALKAAQLENEYQLKQYQTYVLLACVLLLFIGALIFFYVRNQRILREQGRINLEQRLLRSQMNPHFMFNVLGGLQSLVRSGNTSDALQYLKHFSHLLRQNLELSRNNLVSLHDEIETLNHYLALQQMRFGARFSYHIQTDSAADTDEIQLPPMIIQPFVENAIEHGFRQIDYPGHIDVRIRQNTDASIRIEVEDNGSGLSKTTTIDTQKSSLATQITKERLAWLYHQSGHQPSVSIVNKATQQPGVLVTIDLPANTVPV